MKTNKMKTAILLEDVYAAFSKTPIGKAGDKVKIVSEHDAVFIVQGKIRFSVLKRKLKINE
jgi:hypothetical protein